MFNYDKFLQKSKLYLFESAELTCKTSVCVIYCLVRKTNQARRNRIDSLVKKIMTTLSDYCKLFFSLLPPPPPLSFLNLTVFVCFVKIIQIVILDAHFFWAVLPCCGGFPGGASGKEPASQCRRHRFNPWVGKIPWGRAWQATPVFLPGESPWTEEPGGLESMQSHRVGHD